MDNEIKELESSPVWIPVYVKEDRKLTPLFIPNLPTLPPQSWGKESVGGWDARLPENIPEGTIVFFITSEENPKIGIPYYYCYEIRKEDGKLIARPFSLKLEDFKQEARLEDFFNYIRNKNGIETRRILHNIIDREKIEKGDYDNNSACPFQILDLPGTYSINALILTPQDLERLQKEIERKIRLKLATS